MKNINIPNIPFAQHIFVVVPYFLSVLPSIESISDAYRCCNKNRYMYTVSHTNEYKIKNGKNFSNFNKSTRNNFIPWGSKPDMCGAT